jgi:hypothetical protein
MFIFVICLLQNIPKREVVSPAGYHHVKPCFVSGVLNIPPDQSSDLHVPVFEKSGHLFSGPVF